MDYSAEEDFESLFFDYDDLSVTGKNTIYAASVNLAGLYTLLPIKCTWNEKARAWRADSGDFDIPREGVSKEIGSIKFASFDKQEVAVWISGFDVPDKTVG